MRKRSGKFYSQNEKEVMRRFGLVPTKGSGSGWLEKEDGQNEHVICQLKSTDADSIRIKLEDINKLEYNATVSHKIPVFMIQFLKNGEVFVLVKPSDLPSIAEYLECGSCSVIVPSIDIDTLEIDVKQPSKIVKSNSKAKKKYYEQREKEMQNRWQKK